MKKIACELFAGVGGFHLGLSRAGWSTIWANQWEPSRSRQDAYECYIKHFPNTETLNIDIAGKSMLSGKDNAPSLYIYS